MYSHSLAGKVYMEGVNGSRSPIVMFQPSSKPAARAGGAAADDNGAGAGAPSAVPIPAAATPAARPQQAKDSGPVAPICTETCAKVHALIS